MPKKFFQRSIVRFETRDGLIVAAHLSCGHRVGYKRPRPAGSKRSAMPCSSCGSGTRVPWEAARADARIETALERALADPSRRAALGRATAILVQILATPPVLPAQVALWSEAELACREAGLRSGDIGQRHDDLTQRGSLSREQRRAISAFGSGRN